MENKFKRKSAHGDPDYDKVYTDPDVMRSVMEEGLRMNLFDGISTFLDPTAGDGRLREFLPTGVQYIASDADPQAEWIDRADYRSLKIDVDGDEVMLGFNPPFGYMGRGARDYVKWFVESLAPRVMVLVLPHIIGGWLPDDYEPVWFSTHDNIFAHGVTKKRVRCNVRIYYFVRKPGYVHPLDLVDRYEFSGDLPLSVAMIRSSSEASCVPPMHLPVLWVKRVGERSGRVVLVDCGCSHWFFQEPGKPWAAVVPADIGKSMRLTTSWFQIWGTEIGTLLELGAFFVEKTTDADIFTSGSSLSAPMKTGSLPLQFAKFFVWEFFQKK